MHLSRLIVIISSLAGVLATFLPWKRETLLNEMIPTAGKDTSVILSSMQVGDGWLTLALFVIVLLIALTGDKRVYLKGAKAAVIMLLSVAAAIICIYDINKLTHSPIHPELQQLATVSTAGYALYLALTASILIFFATLFTRQFRPVGKFA